MKLSRWHRILLVGLSVSLGLAAGLGTRVLAQTSQRYTIAEVVEARKADKAKPRYYGDKTGIIFKPRLTLADLGCQGELEEAEVDLVVGSALEFSSNDLPEGFDLYDELRYKCDGRLVYLAWEYHGPTGQFMIVRSYGNTALSVAPEDRIQTLRVAGRPAVLIKELPEPGVPRNTELNQWKAWRVIVLDQEVMTDMVPVG